MSLTKPPEQIERIRKSAKILALTLQKLAEASRVGANLWQLEELAKQVISDNGAKPAFLGYHPDGAERPYPFALCTSLNEVVVHGQPHNYCLRSGDILKLDLGVNWQGGISDEAITLPIGKVTKKNLRLVD